MAQFNSDESGPNDYERKSRLARFEGSGAISSSDYFGRDEGGGGGGGGSGPGRAGSADFDVSAGELINKLSFQVSYICTDNPEATACLLACVALVLKLQCTWHQKRKQCFCVLCSLATTLPSGPG